MKTFGERLKNRRLQLGLTQLQLASRVGVSRVAVAQWETEVQQPSGKNLIKLGDVLVLTPTELLTGKKMSPQIGESVAEYNIGQLRPDQIRLLLAYESLDQSVRERLFRFLELD